MSLEAPEAVLYGSSSQVDLLEWRWVGGIADRAWHWETSRSCGLERWSMGGHWSACSSGEYRRATGCSGSAQAQRRLRERVGGYQRGGCGSLVLLLLPLSLSHRRWYRRASIPVNYNNIVIIIMAEDVARVAKAILPTSAGKVCANPFNLALPLALCINLAHLGCRTHPRTGHQGMHAIDQGGPRRVERPQGGRGRVPLPAQQHPPVDRGACRRRTLAALTPPASRARSWLTTLRTRSRSPSSMLPERPCRSTSSST